MSSLCRLRPVPQLVSQARTFSSTVALSSNIGKKPITYPSSVTFTQNTLPDGHSTLQVNGPKGTTSVIVENFFKLKWNTPPALVAADTSTTPASASTPSLSLTVEDASKKVQRSRWGLRRTLIANAVQGLTEGFVLPLKLVGVGFRAALEDDPTLPGRKRLNMKLGFAHPVFVLVPENIQAETPFPTRIVLRGTDKNALGEFAAEIRRWRKPEPYKGKGIFVGDETIKLKSIKKK
ncbi:hypothetical protein FRB96_003591 [Tulasnella sp. 330]|nr:hypothetical protein FRB96_003591 [Tulasnella sp. 330]KAG8886230.1 hypothetical protein FRB97_006233 [Tulasnella sp. 331]KAG8887284.1 hypothetical protein FRB98_000270 [Tulasnella sp. 332]